MTTQKPIPNFQLYGELLSGANSEAVHHETIRERSSKHDWTIRLHRHSQMAQIFQFRSSGVYLKLGELEHRSVEPLILVVAPGVPHGFRFSEDVVGDVLSLRLDSLPSEIADRLEDVARRTGGLIGAGNFDHFRRVEGLIDQIRDVYRAVSPERQALIVGLTNLISLYLSDFSATASVAGAANPGSDMTVHERKAEEFCRLVETGFHEKRTVDEYAADLNISAPHLTRICRSILGTSPNELIRQRRILEAKRLLEYTRLTISEITHRSGFRDAAFFSRSFKQEVGCSPKEFRDLQDG